MTSTGNSSDHIKCLHELLQKTDTVIIGAGAGLSTSAGFTYTGKRFEDHFADFIQKYGFRDMYSGGFFPFDSQEEYWAYWSRYVFINRYADTDNGTYQRLFELVKDKDYFVLTTNVDHQFKKQVLISRDYSIHRAIMVFFNAVFPAITTLMIMKR